MRRRSRLTVVAALASTVALIVGAPAYAGKGGGHGGGSSGGGTPPSSSTLVLYDTSGNWGYLGELYATEVVNLAGHFGAATAEPVTQYTSGQLNGYQTAVYVGSTYDEAIPVAFLDDVLATTTPVVWAGDNIWQLAARAGDFASRYGWTPTTFDSGSVAGVSYKGQTLSRNTLSGPVLDLTISDPGRTQVLATGIRTDGTTLPYAVRSGNLTYLADNPFPYVTPTDRVLAFEDLLFDALAPTTATRHRALVRLEDIDPTADPAKLKAAADYLSSQGVPFGFGVIPEYTDPNGHYNNGKPQTVTLKQAPALVDALKYLQAHGGTMIDHGYTHQYSNIPNPYTATTGDDYEFYRVTENTDHTLDYVGPLPGDSTSWAAGRVLSALQLFRQAKLSSPTIFEPPHYAASAADYAAFAQSFGTRWDRGLYFSGVLSGQPVDYSHSVGQFFPYVVHDAYGMKVLPENCGDISPEPWYSYPATLPSDIVSCAQKNLVVRDGFASFFFHPYLDLSYLRDTVSGLKNLGYTFVDPSGL